MLVALVHATEKASLMELTLGTELSDRETYLIGSIISQWGFLKARIFEQTLLSFR